MSAADVGAVITVVIVIGVWVWAGWSEWRVRQEERQRRHEW